MIPFKNLSTVMDDFLRDQSFCRDATGPGRIQLVGIRGCTIRRDRGRIIGISVAANPEAITNRYDDTMLVYGQKPTGDRFSALYPMSTQPGLKSFWLSCYRPPTKGCPVVQAGQYEYQRGLHKQRYKALRQAAPVVALRDIDRDAILEPESDRWDYPRWTGVNIHAGGRSARVDYYSAGCQVIQGGYGGAAWKQFRRFVYEIAAGQGVFHYTLIDGRFLGQWFNARQDSIVLRRLYYGSVGERVRLLQTALLAQGYYHARGVDGDFSIETHRGVRRWQRSTGRTQTGVVTQTMMGALGIRE